MDPRLILICIAPSGNIRRFRRICEHIQSMVCAARRAPPASPRAQRRTGKGQEMSESSSCGSDTSERITDRLGPATRQVSRVTRDILSVVTTLDVYLWSSFSSILVQLKLLTQHSIVIPRISPCTFTEYGWSDQASLASYSESRACALCLTVLLSIFQDEAPSSPRCRPHSGPVEIPSYLLKVRQRNLLFDIYNKTHHKTTVARFNC